MTARAGGRHRCEPANRERDPMFVNRWRITVEWGHCDPAGIVFNSRFFEFFDSATAHLFEAALGMKKPELMSRFECDMPLVDASARFVKPIRFGEVVEIASRVGEFRRSSFDVVHQLNLNGELAAEGKETRVWIGRTDENKMQAKPIPPEIIERLKAN